MNAEILGMTLDGVVSPGGGLWRVLTNQIRLWAAFRGTSKRPAAVRRELLTPT